MSSKPQARQSARAPASLPRRWRVILSGHEDLASAVFWPAVAAVAAALASAALRLGIRLCVRLFSGSILKVGRLPVAPGQGRRTMLGDVSCDDVLLAVPHPPPIRK
jgi:hypothetical protein